ncbi:MAG: 16S rRNA (guanine(527)-N(7))-methyltransferase RsmG [Bacteroidales bacterium]|nr:16S rRNA (guanine(527)-N(7))-methyltransferase RsmG [Bacteroidales bacterium]
MIEIIRLYFPLLNAVQQGQLLQMKELYEWWNARINLISRKDMVHFYERHVLHSLSIASFIRFPDGSLVMDAGTGGGFPGIPLAILFPEVQFHLVDSVAKKINAVGEIYTALGLNNVSHECNRIENVKQQFDYIVSRAVTSLPDMVRWTGGKINHQKILDPEPGIFYLKGGDIMEETKSIRWKYNIYYLKKIFNEPYFETKLLVHLHKT